jgi:hypothetical protein
VEVLRDLGGKVGVVHQEGVVLVDVSHARSVRGLPKETGVGDPSPWLRQKRLELQELRAQDFVDAGMRARFPPSPSSHFRIVSSWCSPISLTASMISAAAVPRL